MTSIAENPGRAAGVLGETASDVGAASAVQPTWSVADYVDLIPEHAAELIASAVPPAVAEAAGVRSVESKDELPESVRWIADRGGLPAILYPMQEVNGTETFQVKPAAGSVTAKGGRTHKYLGPSRAAGSPPELPVVRAVDGADTVVLVEGCKQALAALAVADPALAIHRFTGVNSWMVAGADGAPGSPTRHLPAVVSGRNVVVVGDADAATNVRVYDGLWALGRAAKDAGAASVRFVRAPGDGKQGVDDDLAALPDEDARREALAGWIASAAARPAPVAADELARMRVDLDRTAARKELDVTRDAARADVRVDGDWHLVAGEVSAALCERLGGQTLFRRVDRIVRPVVSGSTVTLRELDQHGLHRAALEAVRPVKPDYRGVEQVGGGLARDLLGLVREHVSDALPEIRRVSSGPVVRKDGTIVTTNGYDSQTGVLLHLSEDVAAIEVPEHPTDAQVQAASDLLRYMLFESDDEAQADGYDAWVFDSEADRTHAMALVLTSVLRSGVPAAPLFLADGLQRGVGKGFLLKVVHRIVHGSSLAASPLRRDEEFEKRVTADLLAGKSTIVLDEVNGDGGGDDKPSLLSSPALLTLLTTDLWCGRILGRTETVELEQDAVWVATGNNVQVPGDLVRRVVPIRLSTDRQDPDTRSNFRHGDNWAAEHRRELLTAVLTLVRAWYDRGQPADPTPAPVSLVGYGEWQRVVGGILALAGCPGFLSTIKAMRAEADSESLDMGEHLAWLEQVASRLTTAPRFTAKDALLLARVDPDSAPPYRKSWDELDGRKLGRVWKSIAGRWFGDLRIVEDGFAHGNVRAWRVESSAVPSSTPVAAAPAPAQRSAPVETMHVKDRDGRVSKHVRVAPAIDGASLDDLAGGVR